MSYTFPAAYAAELKNLAVEENYLVQLFYDDEGAADFTGLSLADTTVSSVQYYGVINDISEFSERIDLRESKASSSNVTLYCSNKIKNTNLSTLLFANTYEYINRKVKIYSQLNGDTTLTNCLLLFEGKTVKLQSSHNQITIEIEAQRPWDKIVIPQYKTQAFGNYRPLAYGDFVQDTKENFYTSKYYYPMPRELRDNNNLYFLCQNSIAADAKVYFYDENLDKFIAFDDGSTATVSKGSLYPSGNAYHLYVPLEMAKTFNFRATGDGSDDFSATGDAYDQEADGSSDTSTCAYFPSSGYNAETSDTTYQLILTNIPEPVGRINVLKVHASAQVHIDGATSAFGATAEDTVLRARYVIFGNPNPVTIIGRDGTQGDGTSTETAFEVDVTTYYDANSHKMETTMVFEADYDVEAGDTLSGWVKVFDAYYEAEIYNEFDTEEAADIAEGYIRQFTMAYCGDDGLDQSFTDGSGLAELPHEIHRDLLARFTDMDYADSAMTGWSSLDTDRSGWTCHWWTLEPLELKEVLEKIQYEGCFIFIPKTEGSGGRYIHVEDEYEATDIVQIFTKNDYSAINISTTDLSELATNYTYNYQRHPATNQYLQSVEYGNVTQRTNWNVGANENKTVKNLDFITADVVYNVLAHTAPNDCVALYYDNIVSEPKIIVEFELINLAKSNVQVGDIITFNDTDLTPFGKTWGTGDNSLFFMITETKRGLGSITIIAREVYDNLA